ncbi:MAG TPA: S9 family peptidase [Minicystis sp.]|nr:S9 family peptidase [Minicystis sp.]
MEARAANGYDAAPEDPPMRIASTLLLVPLFAACAAEPTPAPVEPAAPPPAPSAAPSAAPAPEANADPDVPSAADKAVEAQRAPLATALVDAFTNSAPFFTRDGKRVLFTSNRDGAPELYLGDVAAPSAPPVALTRGPERVDSADVSRDGKWVVFTRDQGADENFRIYKVGLDGKNETLLTPGPKLHRDFPFEPKRAAGTLVYTQHDPKSPASELVVLPLAGGEPKVVYKDPAPAFLLETTQDGKRALLVRWNSASDLVLYEVDMASGKAHTVHPAAGKKVAINDARYAPDGKTVFVSADDGAEGQFVYALDPATGKKKAEYRQADPPTAFVSSVQVAPRGDKLAIVVNAGNHSEVRLLDARTLAQKSKVKTPLGWIEETRFSDDGSRLGLQVSTPDAPADVYAVDVAKGTVAPLRSEPRPGLSSLPPIEVSIQNVKAFDGLTLPVNVYLPKSGGKKRVLASFHGGPSWSYQVRWNPFARYFLGLGYAVIEPNVRGSTGFGRAYEMADDREKRADWLKDLESINAWAKAQPWADADRVVVEGGSYGGYTVLMALTRQPKLWRAGVDLFGVANLFTFLKSTDQTIRAGFVQEFGDLDKDKALLEEFSPMRDVDKITAPLFVYAGANDPRVPRTESDQIVKALRTRRVPVEYMVAPNEGHSLDRRENKIEFMTRCARFLDEQLK